MDLHECYLCPGDSVINCDKNHNCCEVCLTSYIKVLSNQNLEQIKNRNGKIKCFGENCDCYLSESEVAKNIDNEVFLGYISSLKGYLINEELSKKVSENEVEKADKMFAEILNSKCPNCSQVWFNSDACMAVECCKCGVKFCGFCCEKTFSDQLSHHNHVKDCEYNPRKGDYFCSQEVLEKIVVKRNNKTIENYLSFLKKYIKPDIYEKIVDLPVLKNFIYEKHYQEILDSQTSDELYEKAIMFIIKYNKNINDKFINFFSRKTRVYSKRSLADIMLANKNYKLLLECIEQGSDIDLIPDFYKRFISDNNDEININNISRLIKLIDVNNIPSFYYNLTYFPDTFSDYFEFKEYYYNYRNNIPINFFIDFNLRNIFDFNKSIIFKNKAIEDENNHIFLSTNTLILLSMIIQSKKDIIKNSFINNFNYYFKNKILYDEDILLNLLDNNDQLTNFQFMVNYYIDQNDDNIIYELLNNTEIMVNFNNKTSNRIIDELKPERIDKYIIFNIIDIFRHDKDIITKTLSKTSIELINDNLLNLFNDHYRKIDLYKEETVRYYESILVSCLSKGILKESILNLIKEINELEIFKAIFNTIGNYDLYKNYYNGINNKLFFKIINIGLEGNSEFISLIKNNSQQETSQEQTEENTEFNVLVNTFKESFVEYFLLKFNVNENSKKRKFYLIDYNDDIETIGKESQESQESQGGQGDQIIQFVPDHVLEDPNRII